MTLELSTVLYQYLFRFIKLTFNWNVYILLIYWSSALVYRDIKLYVISKTNYFSSGFCSNLHNVKKKSSSPHERIQNVQANWLRIVVYIFGSGKLSKCNINYRITASVKFWDNLPADFRPFNTELCPKFWELQMSCYP